MTVLHFTGDPPKRPAWCDCAECTDYYASNMAAVIHAAASVGIEHGLTTNQSINAYFRERHAAHDDQPAA